MKLSLKAKIGEMGLDINDITDSIARDLVSAVHNLASSTYQKAVMLAGQRLHGTRQQYINALHLSQEGEGVWVVSLDPDVNHLEDGYDGFNMLPKLAMGPKSKPYKDGKGGRYTVIPLRQHTSPVNPSNAKQVDLASRLKEVVRMRKWDKVKEGISGKTGKFTTVERMRHGPDDHPYLKGLTRIREYKDAGGGKKGDMISSAYFTFRVASTRQDSSHWVHPGYSGCKIFPDLEKYANEQLEQILVEFML